MTLLRQIDSDVALQLSVPTTAMLRYFIASYPYYKWARNALNFVFATKRYISGCLEYQELAARFQRIHMQEFALAYEKHLTLRDWWKLYNITAVLLGAWQQLVLANPLGTNAGETFRDAVEVLVGVFEYHTLRMQKVCKQQPIQVKAEAEKLDMRGHLVEIEEYAKDWSNDPFLPLLANVCRDFLQKILH
ncbi:hypothetical protein MMC13_005904 [Lambiella insularis]|nr:hypothetical protein [Lambiella insularis]